jgi:hypothetical protein
MRSLGGVLRQVVREEMRLPLQTAMPPVPLAYWDPRGLAGVVE